MEFSELFDAACCYEWFDNVVHGREEAGGLNDDEEEPQFDYPGEFDEALQSLKSPPAIRAAGPHMLRVVSEWLGANDSRLKVLVDPVVDSLCVQLDKQCALILAHESVNDIENDLPQRQNEGMLSSRFVTSVVFCLLCVFDVYQWEILPVAKLYWSWLSYLLQTKEDADVQKLMSPMILSLILKPAHTAAKVALPELTRALEIKPITLSAAFLSSEPGLEVIRKILDTFSTGYKEADQHDIYNFVRVLVVKALKISNSPDLEKVLYSLSAASETLLVNPIITLSNLILRHSLPYLNQTKSKTKECQVACVKILQALADHAPGLFGEDDEIRKYYHLVKDSQVSGDSPRKIQDSFNQLYGEVTSPWISFVAMTMTSLPERKDCRERACSVLMDCFNKIPDSFRARLYNVVKMLSAFHDRGTVRLAATELLTMLASKVGVSRDLQIYQDLILRTSDVSAIVRARALELLAQAMSGCSLDCSGGASIDGVMKKMSPPSPSPVILISQSPPKSSDLMMDNGNDMIKNQIQCVLHARVLDEKSVVRKGCIPLIEVIYQKEVINLEMEITQRELLEVLADDLIITIRQRFVSTLTSMISFWLEGTGEGIPSHLKVVLVQLARLATDAEEVVYNKVLDAVDTIFLPTIRAALTLNDGERTRAQTLLTLITSDEECYEWFGRALIKLLECRYSETSPWSSGNEFVMLLKLVCHKPRGVRAIRLLLLLINSAHRAISKTPTGQVSNNLGSACLCIFEDITPMIGGALDLVLCNAALEVLVHLAPIHVDAKNRKLIFDSFYQALLCGSVHPSLLLKVALLTIVIMPREQASTSCMAYLSYAKRQLSKFKIAADPQIESQRARESGRCLACACLLCGFSSAVQLVLKCPKLSKFLQQMNKALAVTILSISRYHEDPSVRSMALVAVSHVLLNDESLAKRHMGKLVQTAMAGHLAARNGMMTNLPFATYDFSVCLTSVMDPYLTMVTACLAQSYGGASENRFAALLLISQLAGLDFIKCKGLIMHHVIYALGDDCTEVSELAYEILQSVLLPRLKDLILVYFVETVCFLTGYYEHSGSIRAFTFAHPLQREVVKSFEDLNVSAFLCSEDHGRRFKIYSKLLSLSQEQSKHLLTGKLLQDFIKPLVSMEDDLPTESSHPCGRALADVLRIISSADMKLRFKNVISSNDAVDSGASDPGTGAETLAKAKYERELMASLHQALRKKNSALQRDVVEAIADIVGELECNMEDLINDKALRRRVEERVKAHPFTCAESIFDPLSDGSRKKLMSSQAR